MTHTKKMISDYIYYNNNRIGQGAYSEVFIATHKTTGQNVAIKVIPLVKNGKQCNQKELEMEIRVLKAFRGIPNIIDFKGMVRSHSNIYLITQLCQSGNLRDCIKRQRRFSQLKAIGIIQQVISGYGYLAQANIIHRDLKPDNIFVQRDQVKIGDFGFAINAAACCEPLKENVGSPLYMAPQALISDKYSFESDIWAIGLIFYQMLKGSSPWESKTQTQLKSQLSQFKIERFLPKNISNKSKDFLMKTIQKKPSQRMNLHQLLAFNFNQTTFPAEKRLFCSVENKISSDKSTTSLQIKQIPSKSCTIERHNSQLLISEANKKSPTNMVIKQPIKIQKIRRISSENQFQSNLNAHKSQEILKRIKPQPFSIPEEQQDELSTMKYQKSQQIKLKAKQILLKSELLANNSSLPSFNYTSVKEMPKYHRNLDNSDQQNPLILSLNIKNKVATYFEQKFEQQVFNRNTSQCIYIQQKQNKIVPLQKQSFDQELLQIKSQIQYLIFLKQLVQYLNKYIKTSSQKIEIFKRNLVFLMFEKLEQLKTLILLKITQKERQTLLKTKEFLNIKGFLNKFHQKNDERYREKSVQLKSNIQFLQNVGLVLRQVHKNAMKCLGSAQQINRKKMIWIIFDFLMSFSKLYLLNRQQNWHKFHLKSNIDALSWGNIPEEISRQDASRIMNKYNNLMRA